MSEEVHESGHEHGGHTHAHDHPHEHPNERSHERPHEHPHEHSHEQPHPQEYPHSQEHPHSHENPIEHVHGHDCLHDHGDKNAIEKKGSDSDDVAEPGTTDPAAPGVPKPNRGEKKCRKAMQKLGLKPVTGINRVTMKRAKNMLFIVENPEVLKSPNADIYVVLGVAKFEDLSQMAAAPDLENLKTEKPKKDEPKIETIKEENEEEEDENEGDLNPEDIKTVMDHARATKGKAIKALKSCNGDTVEAILKLS